MDFRIWALAILAFLGFGIYELNLQELNAHHGFLPLDLGLGSLVLAPVWLCLAATIFPRTISRPSDLFLAFYVLISFVWGSLLWPATNLLSFEQGVALMGLLYFPAFSVLAVRRFVAPSAERYIFPVFLFPRQFLHIPLHILLIAAGLATYAAVGDGGFGLNSAYDRRLDGRDALSGQLLGYAFNMALNGAAPLLAYIAGWRRSPLLFMCALGFAVIAFWLFGLKSPILLIPALAVTGFMLRTPLFRHQFPKVIVLGLIACYGYVLVEVSDGSYSMLADYIVRRITLIQPQLQSYYLDAWLSLDTSAKFFGAPLAGYSDWTFMIGDTYLHNPATNANTNAFLYALLKSGLLGYVVAVVVISAFVVSVDALFAQTAMPEFFGVTGLYGVLIAEQAYTTALLSSGIFLCLALVILFSYPSQRSNPKLVWKS